jgi:hypothetical protein
VTTAPRAKPLRLYGSVSELAPLPWDWVDAQLRDAGTYWVVGRGVDVPAARPVWGVWHDLALHLSIGSPTVRAALDADPRVTVHLPSGTDVVLVEGAVTGTGAPDELVRAYDDKYDWRYDVGEYGPFTAVEPSIVMAWRAAGRDGRDSFQTGGRWVFDA